MIPNTFHFIFGLAEDFGGKPWSLCHYLSVKSALDLNKPEQAYLYYKFMPEGKWFDKIKDKLTLVQVDPPNQIYGNKIEHYAHKADVIRLQNLYRHGGIYMDLDTISVKPFTSLLNNKCVLGEEKTKEFTGLCNGVILAEKGSEFIKHWITSYETFNKDYWNQHSVRIPSKIASQHPDTIHIEPHTSFHYPTWEQDNLPLLFEENKLFPKAYCHHVWESVTWDKYLKALSIKAINEEDTSYNTIARNYIKDL